jgi:hypothetical protein
VARGDTVSKGLLLDMDGLLTDFQREQLRRHQPHNLKYEDVKWDFWTQMGKNEVEFWGVCDFDFWADMPWTPEGEKLLANIERIVPRKHITLLSAPGSGGTGMDGKMAWIKRNIPEYRSQYFFGPEKWRVAHAGVLLVDDSDQNCISFKSAGGEAILVPRPWNLFKDKTNADGTFKMRPLLSEIREWWEK